MRMSEAVIKPMRREGWPFLAAALALALLLGWIAGPLLWLGLGLAVWVYYFFRDPPRVTPQRAGLVVSPADGIVAQALLAAPPPELGLGSEPMLRIAVFMNVFDCHVNRSPVAGRVTLRAHRPGRFLNASLDKASEENERMGYVIEGADGQRVGVVQIAGLVARRIVSWSPEGRALMAGERIGMIRFGSRVDTYLPAGTVPLVLDGQVCVAGETVLADLSATESRRPGRRD